MTEKEEIIELKRKIEILQKQNFLLTTYLQPKANRIACMCPNDIDLCDKCRARKILRDCRELEEEI